MRLLKFLPLILILPFISCEYETEGKYNIGDNISIGHFNCIDFYGKISSLSPNEIFIKLKEDTYYNDINNNFISCRSIEIPSFIVDRNTKFNIVKVGEIEDSISSKYTEIIFPKTIRQINAKTFSETSTITRLASWAVEPPVLENPDIFINLPKNISVRIPKNSLELYSKAIGWSHFENYIETVIPESLQ